MSTQDSILVDTTTAAQKYSLLQAQHPAYYRAWNSMIRNNSADSIALAWRGVFGLMRFIEDMSTSNPNPDVDTTVRWFLKRKQPLYPYSAANCYWYTPPAILTTNSRNQSETAPETAPQTVETFTALSTEEVETRLTELFNIQFNGGTLTTQQQAELDILAAISAGESIPTAVSIPKCEDI